jgi:transcriptional regulator with XRE-family HTH domain
VDHKTTVICMIAVVTGDFPMDSAHTGARVRYWRVRRGLNRQQFAQRVGRSVSWLEKVEAGERALARLPMLEEVAKALGITIGALTDPLEAERAVRSPDAAEVAAIRGALGRYEVILGAPTAASTAPQLSAIAKQVDYLNKAFLASNFSSIGRHLPRLIVEAQRAVEIAASDVVPATRYLVQTYRVASSTLLKLDAKETAWLAADRAVAAAQRSQDTYCLTRSTRSVARTMMSLDQTADVLDALLAMAHRMQPDVPASSDDVAAMYGMVLLAAEIAAAKLSDLSTADTMHEEATRIAEARFSGSHDSATAFGITNVLLHRVSAYLRLGRSNEALDYAARIDRQTVEQLPRERRSVFLLDIAEAHHQVGHYEQAVNALVSADQIAPEEVRCRPASQALITSLVNFPGHAPTAKLRTLAQHAGVPA